LAGWLKSGDINKAKAKSDSFKANVLTDHFARKYLPLISDLPHRQIAPEIPETIWQFWDNPAGQSTPNIVKACIKSVKRYKGNFNHKILDNSTIGNYTDLPGYVFDKFKNGRMDYAHFSDLLRLNLLKNHGGVWMDATGYMTDFVPNDIIGQDFFVFLTGDLTHYPYSFMQSCFIRAKKGSFIIDAWHKLCINYWKGEEKRADYFQIHLMFKALVHKNPVAKEMFANMPKRSDDEIHQLVGDNIFEKFDEGEWDRIKKASFFQKTSFKKNRRIIDQTSYSDTYFSRLCADEA
jgi:hypothetical protein